jgi:hypothetical protein
MVTTLRMLKTGQSTESFYSVDGETLHFKVEHPVNQRRSLGNVEALSRKYDRRASPRFERATSVVADLPNS